MNDVSEASKIIGQCKKENINPFGITFVSGGCNFTISADDIRNYFMESKNDKFNHIV